ncbi:MAG: T9SS type A sorting domain-containing protein, partial [Ignavibacteriaceae bacterium]|nr:T9SS type A sorting domain-containing protein [Ignavibacteriaceae bacterium]
VQAGLSNIGIVSMCSYGDNLFAGTYSDGVFSSSDFGKNWTMVGLKDNIINSLVVAGDNLFAATDSACVWRCPLSELTAVNKEVNAIPKDFTLSQNHPNPFNPTTTISYSLPSSSNIKLIVYNTLGQSIKTLESGYKPAGNYSINFNAYSLPSGIYFYKLEAGPLSQIKKMMLIK